MSRSPVLGALLLANLATPAAAQQMFPATLAGHALLPASTFVPAPADAPDYFDTSGRFTGPGNARDVSLYTREGQTWLSAEEAPRTTGMFLPFVGQPVQGFSGISTLDDGSFLVLTDNGFGGRANSADALLMSPPCGRRLGGRARGAAGHHLPQRSRRGGALPDHHRGHRDPLPDRRRFRPGEHPADRRPNLVRRGEFGPYVFATDREGAVVALFETEVEGEVVHRPRRATASRSPPRLATLPSGCSAAAASRAWRPRRTGFLLYPMFEAPLRDPATGEAEAQDGVPFVRVLEFDVAAGQYTGTEHRVRFDAPDHYVGDFNMISDTHALYIERDGGEGDPRLACEGAPTPTCFNQPAEYKRVWLIDFSDTDEDGFVRRIGYVDLLDIADPDGVALHGTIDGRFTFPMVTIEDVDRVDAEHIVVGQRQQPAVLDRADARPPR